MFGRREPFQSVIAPVSETIQCFGVPRWSQLVRVTLPTGSGPDPESGESALALMRAPYDEQDETWVGSSLILLAMTQSHQTAPRASTYTA